MSAEENKNPIRRYIRASTRTIRTTGVIDEYIAEDCVVRNPPFPALLWTAMG
jgi:hypothetical protein